MLWLLTSLPPGTYQLEHQSDGSLLFAIAPVVTRPRVAVPGGGPSDRVAETSEDANRTGG